MIGRYLVLILVLFSACNNPVITIPKPVGYMRIEMPPREYTLYKDSSCSFSFETPFYSRVRNHATKECFKYIDYPYFNAQLFCSYFPINGSEDFLKIASQSRKMAYEHNIKANNITEESFKAKNGVGLIYLFTGNSATNVQFYVSDSTQHFFRGALYFNSVPNYDSLKPMIDFITEDIKHMGKTFEFK